jgi:hypothetical protein
MADHSLGDNLIFVISQPRAGSTLLQKILGAHPEIHTVSEPWIALHPLFALRREVRTRHFDLCVARNAVAEFLRNLPEGEEAYCEALRRMLSYLYERALSQSGKRIFLDKTPRYYFIISELRRVFPRARLVFLLRNPVAVVTSILETWCKLNPALELCWSRDDLMTAPQLILDGISQAGAGATVVRYEDLVVAPGPTVTRLCSDLGIAFDTGMLAYGCGQGKPERWVYGDQGTVYEYESPVPHRAERWREVLASSPTWAAWAHGYLQALGPDIVGALGYDYEGLCASLPSGPASTQWTALMSPPDETMLQYLRQELLYRTERLEELNRLLAERTAELDRTAVDLQGRTAELVTTRQLLAERTVELDRLARTALGQRRNGSKPAVAD